MNHFLRIATLCAFAFVAQATLSAGVITVPFSVTVDTGPFSGTTGTGSFTYDEIIGTADIGPVGSNAADIEDPNFALTLDIFGFSFDATNDIDYPDFPLLSVANGVPASINYILVQGVNGVDFGATGVSEIFFPSNFTIDGDGQFSIVAEVVGAPVPEPATLAIFGCVGLMAVAGRRRKTAKK